MALNKIILISEWLLLSCLTSTGKEYKLIYTQPASKWEEALPIGNGRIGAMVYGDPINEEYQLNEETLWSGYPHEWNNSKAIAALPKIREAVNNGDYALASLLWKENAQGPYTARYLPLGILNLHQLSDGKTENYIRSLDLNTAISTVDYTINGIKYRRESFISYPDQIMVVHITASQPNSISIDINLKSDLWAETKAVSNYELLIEGRAPYYVANRNYDLDQIKYSNQLGIRFLAKLRANITGGVCTSSRNYLSIRKANEVVILFFAATDFLKKDVKLNNCTLSYSQILKRHLHDYQSLFDRVNISLGSINPAKEKMTTDERLRSYALASNDNGLIELFYQYGRYLMIASSRPGGLPANLQGIWNNRIQPPWGSNYTTNINLEMNYWIAEEANLSECVLPLFDFIKRLAINGTKTAHINYGIDKGWVVHHNTDIWGQTAPTGGYNKDPKGTSRWSCWPMAGAWLVRHLWEHYAFNLDKNFLSETAYPLMKGAAEFLLQWLQRDDKTGRWITNPSTSPENEFYYINKDGEKQRGNICKNSGMDLGITWDLFTNCIEASKVLGIDKEFRQQLESVKTNLQPLQVGSKGQLLEWGEEYEETDINHRHVSHLFALHPGREILPGRDKALADACRKTLELRGDDGTGWSMAWKVNLWARLFDGNHALKILKKGLNYVDTTSTVMNGGGVYANLLDAHPPFQIDGNFGAAAGISEMLVQSHAGYIHILPALPTEWPDGQLEGIRARGGFVINIIWKAGKVTTFSVTSTAGGTLHYRIAKETVIKKIETHKGQTIKII